MISELKSNGRNTPIMLSSSIQASLDNAYGTSKAQAETLVADYGKNPVQMHSFIASQMSLVNGADQITTHLWRRFVTTS